MLLTSADVQAFKMIIILIYNLNLKNTVLLNFCSENAIKCSTRLAFYKCGSRGGQGVRTRPGKSQVIWVSIGNTQLDPPPPLEKVGPPWRMLDPLWSIENDGFLWNWLFDFCKISWGLEKKKMLSELFCQTYLDPPPPPPLMKFPGSAHVLSLFPNSFNKFNKTWALM